MYRNITVPAGSTYTVKQDYKLCVERIILFPATPGTSMTLTTVSHNFPPTITVREAIVLDGPFIIYANAANATLAPATGHMLLVGADQLPH